MSRAQLDKKVVIGFDLDGVIIDHTANKLLLAEKVGWHLKRQQTPSDIIKQIIPRPILTGIQERLYQQPDIAFSAPMMRGAMAGLAELKKRAIPFFLISRRQLPEMATLLLKNHGLWPRFFDQHNTFFVEKLEDKNRLAQKLRLTHYVDDEISVLEKMPAVKRRILFDGHNALPSSPFFRVNSWSKLIKIFGEISPL